jgi:pimeloyl-ACP methyl ester carboxylesterase
VTLGRIEVDGGEISYEVAGSGRAVVLLHPGAMTMATWDREFELLAAEHTVIRYDARSHGSSSTATGPFSHHDDLRRLLDALDVERAVLVGLSLGSRTSVDFALTWPDRVDRMALGAPGVSGMVFEDPFVVDQMRRLAAEDLPGVVEPILRMWVDGPRRTPEQMDPELRARCHRMATETLGRHGQGFRVAPIEAGAIDRLAELTVPVTVALGELDSSDIAAVADRLATQAKQAALVTVPDAGHVLNLEQPARFAEILRASV